MHPVHAAIREEPVELQDEPIEYVERYFFTPSAIEKMNAIWPIRLGQNIAKPHYHVGPRTTPYYSLHFVLEGEGTYTQGGVSYPLSRNDMFCLFPHCLHEYFTDSEKPLKLVWIAFDGKKALPVLERLHIRPDVPYARNVVRPEVRLRLGAFFRFVQTKGRDASDLTKLAHLFDVFGALADSAAKTDKPASASTDSWLQKGAEYLEMHYAEGITIEKAASFAGVDRAHFSRTFRSVYGTSPSSYVLQLKMAAAREMLARSSWTLTEIALSVGYPDLFSFSKAFKKYSGMSPGEYRKSLPEHD
ncbi:helix-turn-helix transcriptional regulator [Paenibacillus ginsengarvi]|uniref:AraC family transcriptional regulator n=1 Tax=Paenibacillus ginsengarvi TaxID=400777 RepID=A0A3B0CMM3_9BACL|nr:AraC family transcriptional regulator [Paenibacillus ginsengarvi]RKN86121.1 AraC family transcriptional regulator [Paenibacillus ginsengarvi]